MSKKQIKKPNQHGGSTAEQPVQLTTLIPIKDIGISLPQAIKKDQLNLVLVQAYLKNKILNKKVTLRQQFTAFYLGQEYVFTITSIDGQTQTSTNKQSSFIHHFVVSSHTNINLQDKSIVSTPVKQQAPSNYYAYELQIHNLQETIIKSLFDKQFLVMNGIGALKGMIVSGQGGSGKTAILRQIKRRLKIKQYNIAYKEIDCSEIVRAPQLVRQHFQSLSKQQPAVLIFDNAHIIFSQKEISTHQHILSQIFTQMDLILYEQVFVIAVSNSEVDLDKSVRSSGRFEKEIKINLPNHASRLEILHKLLEKLCLEDPLTQEQGRKINLRLNGFTIGQIKQIIRQAFTLFGKSLNYAKFDQIVKKYRPTEIKELIVDVPEVYWHNIGGYSQVKSRIKDVVQFPLLHPDLFIRFGIQPNKGILLYGPPGCSKTMMAKAIATQSKLNFISIKGPQLYSKYVGESQKAIREIFSKARLCSPCIIFFDEIDAIASNRSQTTDVADRVLCQLLNEMDGIEGLKDVKIIGATNRPEILDNALMRPGRFDDLIYVGPPDETARKEILKIYLGKSMRSSDVEDVSTSFAKRTEHYTGAELALLCRQAVLIGLKKSIQTQFIEKEHLEQALSGVKSRLTRQVIERYLKFKRRE